MHAHSPLIAALSAGLLLMASIVPTAAADDAGRASGSIKWYGTGDVTDLRSSSFRVVDGSSGTDYSGDSGWYYLSRKGVGTLWLDVECVEVGHGWAEFAGTIASATGDYKVDQWFLVSVADTSDGRDDVIGMGGRKPTLAAACSAATDGIDAFGRQGDAYRGRIRVKPAR